MSDLRKVISHKYMLALFIIGSLNCLSFVLLEYSYHSVESYSFLINISGRQRMLSQKISLVVYQFKNEENQQYAKKLKREALKDLKLFSDTHNILTKKSKEYDFEIPPKLIQHYFGKTDLDKAVKKFIVQSEDFLNTKVNDDSLQRFIYANKSTLLKNLDTAVKYLENASDEITTKVKNLQLIIFILSTITLFLIFFLVFKPMEKQILDKEKELQAGKEKADEENRYKSIFLANMSHELRTPLNGVLGVADLLSSTQLTKEQRDYLEVIDQSGNTLLAIISDILDITKIDMDGLKIESVPFETKPFFSSLEKVFHYQFLRKNIDLKFSQESIPEVLKGDQLRLRQILTNLLSNALKFTEVGSVELEIAYQRAGQELHFKVIDTGIGIDPQKLEHIFEPFMQEDDSTTRIYGGSGLGLSITRELITKMGGSLKLESTKNQGSTFTGFITIEESEASLITPTKELKKSLEKAQILIVDDNDINLKLLKKLLEKSNISVRTASSGAEAIDIACETPFELVLMDFHMPRMNGIEASQEIFAKLGKAAPKILCLTADLSEETYKKAISAGILDVIEKPIRKNKLIEVLAKYIAS